MFEPLLALALGRHRPEEALSGAADQLKTAAEHCVLLHAVAHGAADSRELLARAALHRLPPAHLARTFLQIPDGQELPEDVLDDMGDIHIVKRVLEIAPGIAQRRRLTNERSDVSSD